MPIPYVVRWQRREVVVGSEFAHLAASHVQRLKNREPSPERSKESSQVAQCVAARAGVQLAESWHAAAAASPRPSMRGSSGSRCSGKAGASAAAQRAAVALREEKRAQQRRQARGGVVKLYQLVHHPSMVAQVSAARRTSALLQKKVDGAGSAGMPMAWQEGARAARGSCATALSSSSGGANPRYRWW